MFFPVPSKSLISSTMLTSHESRVCAKEFYNFQVDVYAMPPHPPIIPYEDSYEELCSRLWLSEDEDHEHKKWAFMTDYW